MVHTLLAAIVITCIDGGSFEHRIERGADGALGGCKLSNEASPRGVCAFKAVTPAACSRLTLRLYPKQYEADPHGNTQLWRVGSEQWQFEVAGEGPGAESVASRRDAHTGEPCVLF
jgi:hypothetical protein